ncbi:MFS transporter [Trematosphaeria pertusa]|uniref:MFS transporter n=1 Tax=Trematosphaeria pertusa TaxID=390896 RepID=A0A6A6HWG0_9PLEO|nr:MFS transporter [Trematosphaeria pertusa]KAF2242351.1 MFS transporter [Trematosphaeria pertusa]
MGFFPQLRGRTLYRLMKIVCGTSFMMYGYDAGVLGGVLLHPPFLNAIGNPTNVWTIPMITASYDLAACVTAVGIAFFTFNIGRRGTIIMGNIAAVIGSVIQASSYSVGQLITGRLCTGFAIGCISSAVPTYLSETGIEIGDRGPANAFNAILLISGVPLAYWIDYGFTKMDNQASWRVPIIFQCLFAFFSGGTMWFLPGMLMQLPGVLHPAMADERVDTPRWYYARNRWEEGNDVLAQLNDAPVESENVQRTRREILAAIEAELEANSSLHWKQFLTMGITDSTRMKIIRRLCMCFWLPMIREWMGSSLIAYYSSIILSSVTEPRLVSLIAGVLNTFFALGCVPLYSTIERVGRRSVLLYGAITMTLLITIFTVLVAIPQTQATRWAAVGIIFAFLFVFGYAWQGCVWLYCAEIAPLEYRHIGGAATAFGEWLMTFITVFAGPIGFDNVGWYFWLWVISGNVVAVLFVFLLCPETGGKTLEQVDFLFVDKGFAGLRRDFDVGVEELGAWKEKKGVVETREDVGETQ